MSLRNIELIAKKDLAKFFLKALEKQGFDIKRLKYLEVRYYKSGDMRSQEMRVIYEA